MAKELFVTVHCEDEIDRSLWVPFSRIKYIKFNADGSDYIVTDDDAYIPRVNDDFFESVVAIDEHGKIIHGR